MLAINARLGYLEVLKSGIVLLTSILSHDIILYFLRLTNTFLFISLPLLQNGVEG